MSALDDDREETEEVSTVFRFERECRTPYSEGYNILDGDRLIGRADLHFTDTIVQGSLSVDESITDEAIEVLIEAVDEELVMTADTPRDDFIVSVFRGRSLGTFSDDDFADDGVDSLEGTNGVNGS